MLEVGDVAFSNVEANEDSAEGRGGDGGDKAALFEGDTVVCGGGCR